MTPSTLKCLTSVVAASLVFAACDGSLVVFARVDAGPVLLEGDSGITCSKSTTSCGGTCVVTQDDNANCGACGVKCLDSEQCANSRCFPKNCPGVA